MNKKLLFIFISLYVFQLSVFSQIKLEASQGKYSTNRPTIKANTDGVFPVELKITTETEDSTLYIKIYRSENLNGPFNLIIDTMQPNEEYFYLYDQESATPGTKYYYKADLINKEKTSTSKTVCGWGALTHEAFYVYCNILIDKSFKRLTLMNKKKNLDKLGTEDINGLTAGILSYYTKLKGTNGVVTMEYKNFSDNSLVYFNGPIITKANMLASGTMEGTVVVSGMYEGTINYDKIILKEGKASGGTYSVTPKGLSTKELDYKMSLVGIE